MAWTVNAAFLFIILGLSLADGDFTVPLGYIHQYTQIIDNLFITPMTYYVVGGTFDKDPLMDPSLYPFKCGEVRVTQSMQNNRVPIKRQFLQEAGAHNKWRWLSANYYLEAKPSTNYTTPNYVDVFRQSTYTYLAGSMYLLLSDFLTCALLFNSRSGDCELWVTRKPEKGKATNVSFCGAFITACNKKDVRWYYNDNDCYQTWN